MNTFAERLKKALEETEGVSQAGLARACGISKSAVTGWVQGGGVAGENLIAAAGYLQVRPEWLGSNKGPMRDDRHQGQGEIGVISGGAFPPGYTAIDRFDLKAAAGTGHAQFIVHERNPIVFRDEWLKFKGLRPTSCKVLSVIGMSMEPYLLDGDAILVDAGNKRLSNGNVFVLYWGEEFYVKRVFILPDGSVRIVSDNPDKSKWPDMIMPKDQLEHVEVLGRVVWRGG